MHTLHLSLALLLPSLLTGQVMATIWPMRTRLSPMVGMMIAMTTGMLTGLIIGIGAPLLLGGDLWTATLLGASAGVLAGAITGAPLGLMALLDGCLAGLMGGMMGAMLGVMAPEAIGSALFWLLIVYLLASVGLMRLVKQELCRGTESGQVPQGGRRLWALLVLAILGIALFGGMTWSPGS